jgi:opacity protein-like surface antigen
MKVLRTLGLTAAAMALVAAGSAKAENREGWYIGAGALAHMPRNATSTFSGLSNEIKYHTGWGASLYGGYAWGNGFRSEGEGTYHRAGVSSVVGGGAADGYLTNVNFMGNLIYDFDLGMQVTPYIGGGIGIDVINAEDMKTLSGGRILDSTQTKFAYQGIAGMIFDIDGKWSIIADYRYKGTTAPSFKTSVGDRAKTDNASHNFMLGFRYLFDLDPLPPPPLEPIAMPMQPMPAPMPRPMPMAKPAVPAVPQSFMVFFDFDKSYLTPEAKRIVARQRRNISAAAMSAST